jgi:type IV pilus assembly protein PilN
MRITLNLATRPFADLGPAIKRLRIAMGVLAGLAILLAIGLHVFHQKAEEARARDHSLDGRIAQITKERQAYQDLMRQPANAALLVQVGALNLLFDEKAFSWTLAMEDLETVLPGGVQVTSLEPVRAKDGHITLHLRVVGPRDRGVELVSNLEHSRHFLFPRIVGENAESTGAPGEKLEPVSASNRFNLDLLADYNPVSRVVQPPAKSPAAVSENPKSQAKLVAAPTEHAPAKAKHSAGSPFMGKSNPPPAGPLPYAVFDPKHHRMMIPAQNPTPSPVPVVPPKPMNKPTNKPKPGGPQ